MSQENVELVRRALAAFNEPDGPAEFFAPDAVWDMSTFSGWPGRAEFRGNQFDDFLADWTEPYDEWAYGVDRIVDAGEDRVVAVLHQRGKPRGSDSWAEHRYAVVYAIADGLIQRAQVYASPADALAAAGLDVEAPPSDSTGRRSPTI